jgi:hypothetical protein
VKNTIKLNNIIHAVIESQSWKGLKCQDAEPS